MRKMYICSIVIGVIITLTAINFYKKHKICYLNLDFYTAEITSDSSVVYNKKTPTSMELIGLGLEVGQNGIKVTDKRVINMVIDYLNKLPLLHKKGYFNESTRVFIIKELHEQGFDFIKGNKRGVFIRFYDENQIEIGNISIYDEKYIRDANYKAYKVADETISIIGELKTLLTARETG